MENKNVDFVVGIVFVIDKDIGFNVVIVYILFFFYQNVFFFINLLIGEIKINRRLDREVKLSYIFFVMVIDRGVLVKNLFCIVIVIVLDENDEYFYIRFFNRGNELIKVFYIILLNFIVI